MMKNNQNGVTLIALVITIIVLLILAGVSIAMLSGDNGLLTRASETKAVTIEGEVKDRVNLASQAAKIFIESNAAKNSSYSADTETNVQAIVAELNKAENLSAMTGLSAAINGTNKKQIDISFTSAEYKNAKNDQNAKIEYHLTLSGNNMTLL